MNIPTNLGNPINFLLSKLRESAKHWNGFVSHCNLCFKCGKGDHKASECTTQPKQIRKVAFVKASTQDKADATFDKIQEQLNGLSEDDYAKVTERFAMGF